MSSPDITFERVYTIRELCLLWKIGRECLRLIVANEPGVLRINQGNGRRITYRIPESVARRIYERLTAR
jgi:hypothetical protein